MKSPNARWQRTRELFAQATEMPTGQRESFIEQASGDDVELCVELKSLLDADQCQKKKPLTGAISDAVDGAIQIRRQRLIGTIIGPYRLVRVLGHGGMGTVYLGEQSDTEPATRVAIKVVEGAVVRPETRRRFSIERQILANLNHPNIARLFDAGDMPQGYPYLAMDYVEGTPIDRYCDRQRLSLDERIELFLNVCSAVQCAHQNLIIHRDIKPSNILVTADGTPKLLDFGIAKMLDLKATEDGPALTRMMDQLLTPEYASPEQIRGQSVTTASDVYALGIVLHELLTGLRPYGASTSSQLEFERSVCAGNPIKPSTAIRDALTATYRERLPTRNIHAIAALRNLTAVRLRHRLNGDLDAILLRALRSEPNERYSSADQLADDLRRYLTREPVLAKQGNWLYYANRFTRKHAIGITMLASFVVLLAAAIITLSQQARRIAFERDQAASEQQNADAVVNFMLNVFDTSDVTNPTNDPITARDLLDRATIKVQDDLHQPSAVKARLLETIGQGQRRLGMTDRGIGLLREALEIRRRIEDPNNPNLALTLLALGRAYLFQGEIGSARAALEEARALVEENGAQETTSYADILSVLGQLEQNAGNIHLSRQYLDQALPLLRKSYGEHHAEVGSALTSLGYALQWQGDYVAMERVARESVQILENTVPELHPDRIAAESLLAQYLLYHGNIAEAAPLIEKTFANRKLVFGEASSRVAGDLQVMIDLRWAQNRLRDAEIYAKHAIEIQLERRGANNYNTAYSRTTLALIQWQLGKLTAAERELRMALSVYEATLPPGHLYIASAEHFLAEVLLSRRQPLAASKQATTTIEHLKRADAVAWRIARTENTLGQAIFRLGKRNEAQSLLARSYQVLSTSIGPDTNTVRLAHDRLEHFYVTTHNTTKLAALHVDDANNASGSNRLKPSAIANKH